MTGRRLTAGARIAPLELATVNRGVVRAPDSTRIVHLQFRRFAGGPICNLHLQSVVKRHEEIVAAGVIEIVVFHTSADEMREHAHLPFHIVPDPARVFYRKFGVEPSLRAIFSWAFWPAAIRGLLFRQAAPSLATVTVGGAFGLPADFLISPDGRVLTCKYGENANDQWSVDRLLALVKAGAGSADSSARRSGEQRPSRGRSRSANFRTDGRP